MKKISKTVLGFVLGILVAFTLDVAAETLIDSGAVSYSNSKTSETTVDGALDELFSAVDINQKIGTTDISTVGDGTITGAISDINNTVSELNNDLNVLQGDYYLFPTGTDLLSYNSVDNLFVCPNDGYVLLNSWGDYDVTLKILSPNGVVVVNNNCPAGNGHKYLFVKKGATLYVEYSSKNSIQAFYFPYEAR